MGRIRVAVGFIVLGGGWAGSGAGQAVPGPSFRDVINLQSVGSPAISPDGKAIAYTLRTTEWKDNRFDTEIWLWREGGESFQLTRTAKGSSTTPRWSPDGKWLGFLADRGDKQQLYAIGGMGGEALKLTWLKDGVNDFRWSPDGKRVALLAIEPESEATTKRKSLYGEFGVQDQENRSSHLWLLEVDPSRWSADSTQMPKPSRLTDVADAFTVFGFAWSPDGSRIAFDHGRDSRVVGFMTADISVVTVSTREVRPLVTRPGVDVNPIWSPDGKWILFSTTAGDTVSNFFKAQQLAKVPSGGGTPVRLAADFDEQFGPTLWTPDGIWFLAFQKTRSGFFKIDPGTGRVEKDSAPFDRIAGADASADGKWWVIVAQKDAASLPELYRGEVSGKVGPEKITNMTAQIASWTLGSSEVVSWKSKDGTTIEGVLHKPKDFDPAKKYPLLVVIHGGPTGVDFPQPVPFYVYPIPEWNAKGALVLRPNYRGSAGYGEKFRALNVRNLGVGDQWDVMSGVDYLVHQGIVDTTRMGAMGWSQGGYISAFLTTNTTQFKAISVGAGISNWVTYYVSTDIHPFTRQYLQNTPWMDPAIYAKTSPMTTIRLAKTPTLIQHGEFDQRVPIQNAYELYQGLQDMGVASKLIIYKGFGHGINKPKEQLAAVWHNWQWFAKYIWGETVEIPLEDKAVAADKAGSQE